MDRRARQIGYILPGYGEAYHYARFHTASGLAAQAQNGVGDAPFALLGRDFLKPRLGFPEPLVERLHGVDG